MKAITLYQPWATWIMLGWKTIETRTRDRFKSLKGQRIAIHAGKYFDVTAVESLEKSGFKAKFDADFKKPEIIMSAVLCTAFVYEVGWLRADNSENAMIDCGGLDKFGLFLNDVKILKNPLHYKGSQGIFNIPDEYIERAM
jgi:hypothetical protein